MDIFGIEKTYAVARSATQYFSPPSPMEAIRRGGYHEFVGLFVNDGLASWTSFDLDKHEVIKIACYSGNKADFAPNNTGGERHEKEVNGLRLVEIITRKDLDDVVASILIEHSNTLWLAPPDMPWPATDIHNAIVLLDGDIKKVIGGPGLLPPGAAESLGNILKNIIQGKTILE